MLNRFLDKVSPEPNCGCWLWTAASDEAGYGHFGIARSTSAKAHRISYKLFVGEIPDGLIVCHKCDIPSCVNPDHLFLGTGKDNAFDRDAKGRNAFGERNGKAKITAEIAVDIANSDISERAIARHFGISRGTVNAIRSGRTWSHATGLVI